MSSKLSSLLVQDGVVSVKRMEEAFQRQVIFGGSLDTILLEMGAVDEPTLIGYLHGASGMPPADLNRIDFSRAADETRIFPQKLAEKYLIVPVGHVGNALQVLITNPADQSRLDELGFMLGLSLVPAVVPEFRLYQALEAMYEVKMPLRYAGLVKKLGVPPSPAPGVAEVVEEHAGSLQEGLAAVAESGPTPEAPAPFVTPEIDLSPAELEDRLEGPKSTVLGMPVLELGKLTSKPPLLAEPAAPETREAPGPAPPTQPPAASFERRGTPWPSVQALTAQIEEEAQEPPFDGSTLALDEAVKVLTTTTDRDEILQVFLRVAGAHCEFSAVFSVLGEQALGRMALSKGEPDTEQISQMQIPLDRPSLFQNAIAGKAPYIGPVLDQGLNFGLLAEMQRPVPAVTIILPVLIRNRVVCMLYADNGIHFLDDEVPQTLTLLGAQISQAFQRLILAAKREQYSGGQKAAPAKQSGVGKLGHDRLVDVLRRAARESGDQWAKADISAPASTRARHVDGALVETDARPAPKLARPAQRPPGGVQPAFPQQPVQHAPAARNITTSPTELEGSPNPFSADDPELHYEHEGPPILSDRSATSAGYYSLTESGIRDDLGREQQQRQPRDGTAPHDRIDPRDAYTSGEFPPVVQGVGAPVSEMAEQSPVPASSLTGDSAAPSTEDIWALVDDLERGGELGDLAAAALARIGEAALSLIQSRFPGRLTYDRLAHRGDPPPPSVHGPLLNFVIQLGEAAVPYLVDLLESDNPDVRYYATFVFTELRSPNALPRIRPRLFDPEASVRRVAVDVLKAHLGKPTLVPVMEHVRAELVGPDPFRQRCACEVAGAMRDVGSVARLIELTADRRGDVSEASQRALLLITKQAFGDSRRRWKGWWDKNKGRHRIEWLIEALGHKESECRFLAAQELHGLTGETLGYRFDQEKRARDDALSRWRRWWKTKGVSRFGS